MTRPVIDFWFEFASTYSHIAAQRIEGLADAAGVAVTWRPFLLGPIFKAQGWDTSPFNIYPAKGAAMWRDMERECARLGLPFHKPSRFPANSLLAARTACAGQGQAWLPDFVREVYLVQFRDDADIADAGVIGQALARSACPDPIAVLGAAQDSAIKDRLRANIEAAIAAGVFGAPSFVTAGELFWGADRLESALAWAKQKGSDGL